MRRLVVAAGLLLACAPAFGAGFTTAGWYRLEVFPGLEVGAGPFASAAACGKGMIADPDHVVHCVELSKAGDEIDRAIEIFGEAVKKDPRDSSSMNIRGLLYQRKGDTRSAREEFERAMKASPDDFWPYVFRGDLFNETGDKESAIADYTQVLDRHPGDGSLVAAITAKLRKLGAAP